MTTATARQTMQEQIRKHGENLLAIFPRATEQDPDKLCRKLRRLEVKTRAAATDLCNGDITQDRWEEIAERAILDLERLLAFSAHDIPVRVNGDPRGYALKIDDHWTNYIYRGPIHRDMGGYGILAPDYSPTT